MTRKPIAVVKSVLHRNCSDVPRPSDLKIDPLHDDSTWCDYAPFGNIRISVSDSVVIMKIDF